MNCSWACFFSVDEYLKYEFGQTIADANGTGFYFSVFFAFDSGFDVWSFYLDNFTIDKYKMMPQRGIKFVSRKNADSIWKELNAIEKE